MARWCHDRDYSPASAVTATLLARLSGMEERITICAGCGWIHVDGAGEFCNGCGARHQTSSAPTVRALPMQRVDMIPASLMMTLFALLLLAAR
jgi:hypothetical protein